MNAPERYRIEPDGRVVTVYTDTVDLRVLGHVRAIRASHAWPASSHSTVLARIART